MSDMNRSDEDLQQYEQHSNTDRQQEKPQRPEKKKRGIIFRVVTLPLLPWKWTWNSMRNTVMSGALTIRDINARMAERRRNPKVRTFAQAMALRTADAVPLEEIEKTCLANKRIALFFTVLSLAYTFGSMVPENWIGVILGTLFAVFSLLVALKFQHRHWQIQKGKANPHKPLPSVIAYLRSPGSMWMLLNPNLFH